MKTVEMAVQYCVGQNNLVRQFVFFLPVFSSSHLQLYAFSQTVFLCLKDFFAGQKADVVELIEVRTQ